ncbi:MAG: hypothetical protein ACLUZ6_04825 [Lachnospira eligens]
MYATDDMTAANVAEQSRDDVFLTMLVLHQKSTCMLVNEGIQNTLIDNKRQSLKYFRKVKMLKKKRWNFVLQVRLHHRRYHAGIMSAKHTDVC